MKTHGIHKSVRSLQQGRAIGEAPSLGRVSRMPGTGLPKGERRRRKRSDSRRNLRQKQNRRLVLITWSVVIFVFALGGIGAALWFWLQGQIAESTRMAQKLAGKKVVQTRVESKFPSPTEEEAYELVNQALSANTVADVHDRIRVGITNPSQILEYLKSMDEREGAVSERIWLSSMDCNHLLIDGVLVLRRKDDKVGNRLALLTPDASGRWQMDFDAFARTVSPSWEEINKMETGKALVRVMVDRDSYYNGLYQDESRWVCYGMASPDNDQILLGYCRRDERQHKAIQRILARESGTDVSGATARRATLGLVHRYGAEPRQFEISQVLAEDWVVSEMAFEDTLSGVLDATASMENED